MLNKRLAGVDSYGADQCLDVAGDPLTTLCLIVLKTAVIDNRYYKYCCHLGGGGRALVDINRGGSDHVRMGPAGEPRR